MKMIAKFMSFLLIVLYFFNTVEASEGRCEGAPCIERVVTTDEAVLIQIGSEWIVVEGLQVSGAGLFVLVKGEWMTLEEALENPDCLQATWKCGVCGFINYDCIAACGVCGTPRPPKKRD